MEKVEWGVGSPICCARREKVKVISILFLKLPWLPELNAKRFLFIFTFAPTETKERLRPKEELSVRLSKMIQMQ